jgi:ATP synthase F1, delta subunit
VPLSPAQTQRLTQILAAQAGREVLVNVVVDPTLVGGLRIQRGDVMMDGTVSTRADEIRRKLAS